MNKKRTACQEAKQISTLEAVKLIAHELRGPVGIMIGYASMFADNTFEQTNLERRQEAAQTIMRQGYDVLSLIDAMIASLVSENTRTEIDLGTTVKLALERIYDRAKLEAAQILLEIKKDSDPVYVMANQTHILCILTCLLNNALSYSNKPATVIVKLSSSNPAEVEVQDHGYGIKESDQIHLFEGSAQISEESRGFGLGLALSRRLAGLNGSNLFLKSSELDKGSTFVLALPVIQQHD